MSEHIHADIVSADGSVRPINPAPIPGWENGASATPRRMKQPIKDELRRQLEVANAQAAYWKGLLDDSVPMVTVRKLLVVAVVMGFALGRFIP